MMRSSLVYLLSASVLLVWRVPFCRADGQCGGLYVLDEDRPEVVITSPGYTSGLYYPKLCQCIWTVVTPLNKVCIGQCIWTVTIPFNDIVNMDGQYIVEKTLKAVFEDFSVEGLQPCLYDKLTIDGYVCDFRSPISLCGDTLPQPVESQGSILCLRFSSDIIVNQRGFKINVIITASSISSSPVRSTSHTTATSNPPCSFFPFLISTDAILTSPSYGRDHQYPPNTVCRWLLYLDSSHKSILRFQTLDLEFNPTCSFDSIHVLQGEEANPEFSLKLCGSSLPDPVVINASKLIVFTSDNMGQGLGFLGHVQYSLINPPSVTPEPEGYVSSSLTSHFTATSPISQHYSPLSSESSLSPAYETMATNSTFSTASSNDNILTNSSPKFSWGSPFSSSEHAVVSTSSSSLLSSSTSSNSLSWDSPFSSPKNDSDNGETSSSPSSSSLPTNIITSPSSLSSSPPNITTVSSSRTSTAFTSTPASVHSNSGNNNESSFVHTSSSTSIAPGVEFTTSDRDKPYPTPSTVTSGVSNSLAWSTTTSAPSVSSHGTVARGLYTTSTVNTRETDIASSTVNNEQNSWQETVSSSSTVSSALLTSAGITQSPTLDICQQTYYEMTSDRVVVQSPGYETGTYPLSARCDMIVAADVGKILKLTFLSMDIEASIDCGWDWLELACRWQKYGKYCGTNTTSVVVQDHLLMLSFASDPIISKTGFLLQIESSEKTSSLSTPSEAAATARMCNWLFDTLGFRPLTIVSPGHWTGLYPTHTKCEFKVFARENCTLRLTVEDMDLEKSPGCVYDYVIVYDGVSPTAETLARMCGDGVDVIESSGPTLRILFFSDSIVPKRGFKLKVSTVGINSSSRPPESSFSSSPQGQLLSASANVATITSPTISLTSKASVYSATETESRTMTTKETWNSISQEVALTRSTPPTTSVRDSLSKTTFLSLASLQTSETTTEPSSPDTTGLATFSSSSTHSEMQSSTWVTSLLSTPESTTAATTKTTQPQETTLSWHPKSPQQSMVTAALTTTSSSESTHSAANTLGSIPTTSTTTLLSSTSSASSPLSSSVSTAASPDVTLSVVEKACSSIPDVRQGDSGSIASPGFSSGDPYPTDVTCSWIIQAGPGKVVFIHFTNFHLEFHQSCSYDFLEIRNVTGNSLSLIGRFCGKEFPANLMTSGDRVEITFVSDRMTSYSGFLMTYSVFKATNPQPACPAFHTACASEDLCIPREWLCDGEKDCPLGDDEKNCDSCGENEFTCFDQSCLPSYLICDGLAQCQHGEDEEQCEKLDEENVLNVRKEGTWFPVCAENWMPQNVSVSKVQLLCSALGRGALMSVQAVSLSAPYYATLSVKQKNLEFPNDLSQSRVPEYTSQVHISSSCAEAKILSLECAASECGRQEVHLPQPFLLGSTPSVDGQWPWTVAVYSGPDFRCGASLVSPQWLISAGHCFYNQMNAPQVTFARVGQVNVESPDIEILSVTEIINHPKNNYIYENDIALLRLERPVNVNSKLRPVCLSDTFKDWSPNTPCYVAGWGVTDRASLTAAQMTPILHHSKLKLWDPTKCSLAYPGQIKQTMFCAGYENGEIDACKGDSGGPLMCLTKNELWDLVGVVSWGEGCGEMGKPGVYTRVDSYLNWIRAITHYTGNYGVNCTFEHPNMCGYTSISQSGTSFLWTRRVGGVSYPSRPLTDTTYQNISGHYAYTYVPYGAVYKKAALTTPQLKLTEIGYCLQSSVIIQDCNQCMLEVVAIDSLGNQSQTLLRVSSKTSTNWQRFEVNLPSNSTHAQFLSTSGKHSGGGIGIDDVMVSSGFCKGSMFLNCDFDGTVIPGDDVQTSETCHYEQDSTDDFDWSVVKDNSQPNRTESFLRAELSPRFYDDIVRILSPPVKTYISMCYSFQFRVSSVESGILQVCRKLYFNSQRFNDCSFWSSANFQNLTPDTWLDIAVIFPPSDLEFVVVLEVRKREGQGYIDVDNVYKRDGDCL